MPERVVISPSPEITMVSVPSAVIEPLKLSFCAAVMVTDAPVAKARLLIFEMVAPLISALLDKLKVSAEVFSPVSVPVNANVPTLKVIASLALIAVAE